MLPRIVACFIVTIGMVATAAECDRRGVETLVARAGEARRAGAGSAPRAFRITNRTDTPKYLDVNLLLQCGQADGTRPRCAFYRVSCRRECTPSNRGEDCCVMCERDLPLTLELAPDQSYTKAWDGSIFTTDTTHCAKCECQNQQVAPPGKYQVVVRAYEAYLCEFAPCTKKPDGTLERASPKGAFREHTADFTIPSPEGEVVIEIAGN